MSKIFLNGTWQLSSPQHPEINVPMTLPGDNHSALFDAKLISNPYLECNEKEVQWVGESDWTLTKSVDVNEELLAHEWLYLKLSRVDTLATLLINGEQVLSTKNMFRQFEIDIKPFLKLGTNEFEIRFSRPDLEAKRQADVQPFPIPWAVGNNQVPHMNLIRKAQCHSGWDWGICLVVCGIYDDIELTAVSKIALKRVQTEQVWSKSNHVTVKVSVHHTPVAGETFTIKFADQRQSELSHSSGKTELTFEIENPNLWWPAGYGEQPLYDLVVSSTQQTIEKRIGLRRLELNTAEDEIGSAMEFVVNGFPITSKGANWIPMDARPSLETTVRYQKLLGDAVAANMNMIRVWGGGQYESDDFYNTCDELGLLVWQDMMFACSLYPSTDEFIAEVEPEVRDQIRRLKDHPSIALWCGDNEVLGAIGWYDESKNSKVKYTVNYDRLNRKLAEVIAEEDDTRRFWASSPCNGELDFGDAWHDDNRGDMHFWDVWHSGKSFDAYLDIKPRFCSEFGYQSWPSMPEVKSFVPESDWNVTSPTFENHQKNGRGNSIITEMFTRYFRFPSSFENMLYMSQVQQSIAIKTACEYWRAISPVCRGMLFWQLNDNWPVSSWSSIEYSGRWKQLQYHAKRFYSPVYAPFHQTEEDVELRIANDSREQHSVSGKVTWMSWQGEALQTWDIDIQVEADSNQSVWSFEKLYWEKDADLGFFHFEASNAQCPQNSWFPNPKFKNLAMEKAQIELKVEGNNIILESDMPAIFVHLECDGIGRFSDSSFTLLPRQKVIVEYLGDDFDSVKESLRVYSLDSSY